MLGVLEKLLGAAHWSSSLGQLPTDEIHPTDKSTIDYTNVVSHST